MTFDHLITKTKAALEAKTGERARSQQWIQLESIRSQCLAEKRDPTDDEAVRIRRAADATGELSGEIARLTVTLQELEATRADDGEADRRQREHNPTDAGGINLPERTYSPGGTLLRGDHDAGDGWVRASDGRPAALRADQRFGDHAVVAEHRQRQADRELAIVGQHGSLGQMIRAMSTSSGSALVPTEWSSEIIDRARNNAAVMKAGATIVPMDAKIVQIGRLTADPTAVFRAEGSTITESDPNFDNVTLTATTQSALTVGSLEWFQDADNVDEIVSEAIGKAIGLGIDLAALYGSITTGSGTINLATPPNPRGVLGALLALAGGQVLGDATNGTAQGAAGGSKWAEIVDLIYAIRDNNEDPNALIWNTKTPRLYNKLVDTLGQPLQPPDVIKEMTKFESNQIPTYTRGTMASASDVFAGDWTKLLIGQRLDLTIQTLTERYAENGQVGIVAHWRGDIQPARPKAFAVFRALEAV